MPRHPPCALHSLSQQRHNNTNNMPCDTTEHKHKEQQPATPTITGATGTDTTSRKTSRAELQTHLRIALDNTPSQGLNPDYACRQMLASTMQISNNNPTNTRTPQPRTLDEGGPEAPASPADTSGPNSVPDPAPTNAGPR